MEKICISGTTGFVGTNLCAYLAERGCQVQSINLRSKGEISLPADAGTIVHLAGKAHDLHNTSDAQEYVKVNYELTVSLFKAFLKSPAHTFIFISSVKAVADFVSGTLTEEVIPNPVTEYGKSKLMAEEYIQTSLLPQGKFFYILRPCMIHGPGNKGNLNLLYRFVNSSMPWPLGTYENRRSFLSVENLCFVIYELIARGNVPSGVYQIADSDALSTNQLVSIIADELGKRKRILFIPQKFIQLIARIGNVLKLPLTSDRLNKLTESYVVSNKKILNALGKQLPLNSEAGIRQTIKSFAKQH
jgi:nucleoside-diphosphate-sugar epimerase